MLYSLFIKLGMFAVTMGVIFWIGWTLPASFEREPGLVAESLEGVKAETPSGIGRVATVSPSSVPSSTDQPSTIPAPKRSPHGLLDLNSATGQDLDALPGVGPKLVERIMEYRQSVGAFHTLEELRAVKGIGNKTFERIRPLVTVATDVGLSGRRKKAI